MFSPNERLVGSELCLLYLPLTDSHKADIPLSWAKRMLKAEVGVSRGQLVPLSCLPLSTFSHWATTPTSQRSIRACRATGTSGSEEKLIKQLHCQLEVTVILSLLEGEHNETTFFSWPHSHPQPVGPTVDLARNASVISDTLRLMSIRKTLGSDWEESASLLWN